MRLEYHNIKTIQITILKSQYKTITKCTFFSIIHGMFTKTSNALHHNLNFKTNLKFKSYEIILWPYEIYVEIIWKSPFWNKRTYF